MVDPYVGQPGLGHCSSSGVHIAGFARNLGVKIRPMGLIALEALT